MATTEEITQAEEVLRMVEQALQKARQELEAALRDRDGIAEFYNEFVGKWNEHKKQFSRLPIDALGKWAVKDNELELEKKAIDKRFNEIDKRCDDLRAEVEANNRSRVSRIRELQLMRLPDGTAYHIWRQESRM